MNCHNSGWEETPCWRRNSLLLYKKPALQGAEAVLSKGSTLLEMNLVIDYFDRFYKYADMIILHLYRRKSTYTGSSFINVI